MYIRKRYISNVFKFMYPFIILVLPSICDAVSHIIEIKKYIFKRFKRSAYFIHFITFKTFITMEYTEQDSSSIPLR